MKEIEMEKEKLESAIFVLEDIKKAHQGRYGSDR
jgi:hypothetical protein